MDAGTLTVRVLFFGRLKEIVGVREEVCEVRQGEDIAGVYARYGQRWPELGEFRGSVVASRNREFVAWDTPVRVGDEIGFLPPVSGG
jgi:molybdopterin converting factor small subunit